MEPYSLAADLLNKFHDAQDWVQALWVVAVPVSLIALAWMVKGVVTAFAPKRENTHPTGELIYSIYHNNSNELLVYMHGNMTKIVQGENVLLFPTNVPESNIE